MGYKTQSQKRKEREDEVETPREKKGEEDDKTSLKRLKFLENELDELIQDIRSMPNNTEQPNNLTNEIITIQTTKQNIDKATTKQSNNTTSNPGQYNTKTTIQNDKTIQQAIQHKTIQNMTKRKSLVQNQNIRTKH